MVIRMIFYDVAIECSHDVVPNIIKVSNLKKPDIKDCLIYINKQIGLVSKEGIELFVTDCKEKILTGVLTEKPEDTESIKLEEAIKGYFKRLKLKIIDIRINEIQVKDFISKIEMADYEEYLCSSTRWTLGEYRYDYFDNRNFSVKESMLVDETIDYDSAINKAKCLMSDQTMIDEINRIYSSDNPKKFLGHPVHYRIKAASLEAGYEMAKLIGSCLYSNGRLLGRRINSIHDIEESGSIESDLEKLFLNSSYGTVILETCCTKSAQSNYALSYGESIDILKNLIQINSRKTLLIFIEIIEKPGFAKSLLNQLEENIEIINITEGKGTNEQAREYLERLMEKSEYSEQKDYKNSEIIEKEFNKLYYTISDVYNIYNKWDNICLRRHIYRSYSNCKGIVNIDPIYNGNAYDELQKLIGLKNIKQVVDQIIASYKMNKLKKEFCDEKEFFSMHMIFTGNPGSAKTTVARLFSKIMRENGILENGEFVECTRADLVAKYVGWTAKAVKRKFKEAEGGILFIDEAYALIDEGGSFGEEAINTIVEEMELNREKTIVIFAGYPDKMEHFLKMNQGLRSRIAFHIDFPDYNDNELMLILNKMMMDKHYIMDNDAIEKCKYIFKVACQLKDFGNGRFVRNIFEQAVMRQSLRLSNKFTNENLGKEELFCLKAEDFEMNLILPTQEKYKFGFSVAS